MTVTKNVKKKKKGGFGGVCTRYIEMYSEATVIAGLWCWRGKRMGSWNRIVQKQTCD